MLPKFPNSQLGKQAHQAPHYRGMLLPTGSAAMGAFLRHEISRGFSSKDLILIRSFMIPLSYPNNKDPTFRHTQTIPLLQRVTDLLWRW